MEFFIDYTVWLTSVTVPIGWQYVDSWSVDDAVRNIGDKLTFND